jgi:glycosyltransferase involved in cell wall biosynthesis
MNGASTSAEVDARPGRAGRRRESILSNRRSARWVPVRSGLKVLFANKFFFRNGGSETVMFDEIALMRSFDIDVVEFAMNDPRNLPSEYSSYFASRTTYGSTRGVDAIRKALSLIHSRDATRKIASLIKAEQPDILHCHNIYHQLTPSIIGVASRLNIPVVLTLHDYKTVCPVYTQLCRGVPCTKCSNGRFESVLRERCAEGSVARSALLWLEARYHAAKRSYQRVDTFVAPSLFMRDAVAPRLGADKVVHIPNGIDASRIVPRDGDDGYVLYLGRLSREKGIETLLRAHAEDAYAWRLLIAGTGPLLDELRSRHPRAEFTGHLAGEALSAVLGNASIVVVPSEWHENSPVSVLEAMAHAKPIVASRIGGIPELVRDGTTGLLFEHGKSRDLSLRLSALLKDGDLRRRLGRNARRIVETDFSLRKHGETLVSLYGRLAESRTKKAEH